MRLARALGLCLALGLGAAAAGGCSALVTGEVEQVGCQQEGAIGPPACPVGQACRGGQCTACAPKEVCGNGADDDCNGKPDDGCQDAGTGGTGAGGAFGGGGSGGIGGDPQGGTGGAPTGGGGSSGSGATGATGGTDAGTGGTGGTGLTGGTGGTGGGVGSSCIDSTACPPDTFCADPAWFGGSGPKVCARGCCISDTCGTGNAVCFPSVWGGNVCLPAGSVGRGAVGPKTVGTPCGADSECRSGLCDVTCVDTCCGDSDCAGTDYCTRKIIKGTTRSALLCGKPPGTKAFQNPCGGGSECLSAICDSSFGICTKPCCAKKDCSGFLDWECVYNGGVRVCGTLGPSGPTELGQPCSYSAQCKSAQCVNLGQGGRCTDSCCTDKDCGVGFGCKPVKRTDNSIVLLCVGL